MPKRNLQKKKKSIRVLSKYLLTYFPFMCIYLGFNYDVKAFFKSQIRFLFLQKLKLLTARLTGLETESSDSVEPLQIVHYSTGGHYEPHVDYFGLRGSALEVAEDYRGDRAATMLYYLSEDILGGATVFPILNVAIRPKKGSALFWFNTHRHGEGELQTLHAGCPIISGTKWIANFWIRERPQTFKRPCSLLEPTNKTGFDDG